MKSIISVINKGKAIFLHFSLFATFLTSQAQSTIPVIAYMGIPHNQSSDKTFRDFKEAGYDICISNYNSISEVKTALTHAERQGVGIIARCPEIISDPSQAGLSFKDSKAFYGYLIDDEPSAEKMDKLKKVIGQIKAVDNKHLFYVNLLPYYGQGILKQTKTRSYQEYVHLGADLGTQAISFDHYPILKDKMRLNWYENLEIIRQESIKSHLPFWGFVLTTPHFTYPQPTLGSLRLQTNANLAYGAQAIQHYTYWTPSPHDQYDYHNGPIDAEGKKTNTYEMVKTINEESKMIRQLFAGSEILSVHHLLEIPTGTTKQPSVPINISKIKIKGKVGAIISVFTKNEHTYLSLVNKDYQQKMTVKIKGKNNIPLRITKNLDTEKLNSTYSVSGGDILIFRLK